MPPVMWTHSYNCSLITILRIFLQANCTGMDCLEALIILSCLMMLPCNKLKVPEHCVIFPLLLLLLLPVTTGFAETLKTNRRLIATSMLMSEKVGPKSLNSGIMKWRTIYTGAIKKYIAGQK